MDAIKASVKSLFDGLDNTEADNFLQLYQKAVRDTNNASVEALKSLTLRHCECDEAAAMTTPVAIARATVKEVKSVLKVMGRDKEEGISCDLVDQIALLNELVHQQRRATTASVNDMMTCLTATKSLAMDEALQAMTFSSEDISTMKGFLSRVERSIDELKQTVASQQKPFKKAYAEVAETMERHPLPESMTDATKWVEFMRDGGGAAIVASLDELKAEVALVTH